MGFKENQHRVGYLKSESIGIVQLFDSGLLQFDRISFQQK